MQPHLLPVLRETLHRTEKSDNTLNNATQMPHSMAQIFTTANFCLTLTCFLICFCLHLPHPDCLPVSLCFSLSLTHTHHTHMHHSQHVNSCGICVIPPPHPPSLSNTTQSLMKILGYLHSLGRASLTPPPPPPQHTCTHNSQLDEDTGVSA